jgi:hypothetical protein
MPGENGGDRVQRLALRADGDSDDAEHWLLPTEALDAPISFQKRPVAAPRGV